MKRVTRALEIGVLLYAIAVTSGALLVTAASLTAPASYNFIATFVDAASWCLTKSRQ